MRKLFWGVLFVATIAVFVVSCNNNNQTGPVTGQGQVSGIVVDGTTQQALAGVTATATLLGGSPVAKTTGTDGAFSFSFSIDSTSSVAVKFSLTGYRDTTIIYGIKSGNITQVTVAMTRRSQITGGGASSGLAQTIAFAGASLTQLSVRGVGQPESSTLTWEVRDSLGLPVDAAHAIALSVSILNGPGGGEYISPSPITTDANGQAVTTLHAGIKSGVVQVIATGTITTPSGAQQTVSTTPVRFVIKGGYPDQGHFTLASPHYNIPVLDIVGVRTPVSVLVGDKYSNPVAPSTAVYFHTTAGVIEGSALTDQDGAGNVNLISGNPYPKGPIHSAPPVNGLPGGDGYEYVAAYTHDSSGVTVSDSVLFLWSGIAIVSDVNPTTFDIPNAGSQSFTFRVHDELQHPLAAGTIISVTATVPPPPDPNTPIEQVLLAFGLNGSVTLNDVIQGNTDYSFTLSDGNTQLTDPSGTPVTVSISVSGPNGQFTYTINGHVH